ncbi:hypothetical protein [Brachyspira hampsonii]|uniref:Uncharacterized protein n=1 Tax=Brachyspira hampsonii 30446 TaxID=1289135 RepID=A0A2U4FBP1_9SPIR|nr:hypothetical protein [Brachyspira hampsonii]EKV56844.1 hypothetical protein A966_07394 [Brachyspira hampsonii 30446]MBW5390903.1 hypothetical protein [Brachyspira hampsonii]MBW5394558.1 hypothetical protein [Brachyspira hampsonii]OEJ18985.1 hypothetical protein A9495_05125 [Brachyspira hampsonii]
MEISIRNNAPYIRNNTNIRNNSNNIVQEASQKTPISEVGVCKTCASRTYQDGSNDIGVSFKSPTRIDPSSAPSLVASHEQEHVANNQRSAEKSGGEVIFQNVTLTTNICPECKRVYVSGGVTKAAIASSSSKGNNLDTYA